MIYTASCPEPGLYSIEVDVKMKGLTAIYPLPLQVAYGARSKTGRSCRLTRVRADLGYSTRSTYRVAQGDVLNVHPDDDHLYWLPFEPGVNVTVFQGFNGSFSHRRDYAIDLDVPEGTPITATRDGVVIGSRESSQPAMCRGTVCILWKLHSDSACRWHDRELRTSPEGWRPGRNR